MANIIKHISPLLMVLALYTHSFAETVTEKDVRFIRIKMETINSIRAEIDNMVNSNKEINWDFVFAKEIEIVKHKIEMIKHSKEIETRNN